MHSAPAHGRKGANQRTGRCKASFPDPSDHKPRLRRRNTWLRHPERQGEPLVLLPTLRPATRLRKGQDPDWRKDSASNNPLHGKADQMCDRVGIINRGKILACDTPQRLKTKVTGGATWKIEITPNLSELESVKSIPGVVGLSTTDNIES